MGFHALSGSVDFTDDEGLLDRLLIAQLLRDILAIHDDVVDEDHEKFGAPTLPLSLSSDRGLEGELSRQGKDLALFYGDILFGVLGKLVGKLPSHALARVQGLIGETFAVTSSGQAEELLVESSPVADTTVGTILGIAERKAAHYCYVFPFRLGAYLAGHSDEDIEAGARLLLAIGRASQVIDDITGAFPGVVDDDKDSIGEIMQLRRTVPLVLFARESSPDEQSQRLLLQHPPLEQNEALELRRAMWKSDVPQRALELCEAQLAVAMRCFDEVRSEMRIGVPTREYLADLIDFRLRGSLERLRKGIAACQ
jgi:geranylgeranyl pyrophosphate synthase